MGQLSDFQAAVTPEAHPGETGVYRRADVEGFADWARATIDRLQHELAVAQHRATAAEQRAVAAERSLADREELEDVLVRAADQAAMAAADAAAKAAVGRVEALLDDARAKVSAARPDASRAGSDRPEPSAPSTFDDPIRDPLPPWDERLLALPDEQSELPPIGPIFGRDEHRSA